MSLSDVYLELYFAVQRVWGWGKGGLGVDLGDFICTDPFKQFSINNINVYYASVGKVRLVSAIVANPQHSLRC